MEQYAFAFATIVGLIFNFHSEREGKKDLESFKVWLADNNYEQESRIIENNKGLQDDLAYFLNQNHEHVMTQLSILNDSMISLASHMQGLGSIALSFDSNNGLSDQAVDVLRQFVKSGSSKLHHMKNTSGRGGDYYMLEGGPNVEYSEPRFIEDDINKLVTSGLITLALGSKGGKIYKITRQAVRFIDAIDGSQ